MSFPTCCKLCKSLSSVAVHPNFEETRWVYLYYTYNRGDTSCPLDVVNGAVNRCSRFVMNDDWTIQGESEYVLFQSPPLMDKIHNGGDMEFGVDGLLYIMVGDAGGRTEQYAQKRDNLFGSVLRLSDEGAIPLDNPYLGDGTARCNETGETGVENVICQEIFAYGLRNPFRFTMDPYSTDKVRYLISDVGGAVWEEVDVGGTDFAGANYGWPLQEGPCDYDSVSSCVAVADDNSELAYPVYWYQHDEEEAGCVVGIEIPPPGLNWPEKYNDPNSFFFVDFVWGEFYHITQDFSQACATCSPPVPGYRNETFHSWPRPVGLKFGPYVDHGGTNIVATSFALYYTVREGDTNLRRVVYVGGENLSPTVDFTSDKDNGLIGETFQFDASATLDPDHTSEELTFTWDFGDGSSVENGMIVSHQYSAIGAYRVTLIATDPERASGQKWHEISVGEQPSVEIVSPEEGTTFAVGDVLTLVGRGTDSEGNALDEFTQLSWEVRQQHNNHFHPFLPEGTIGNDFAITEAPGPEDFFAATNSYLEILLTGRDQYGIPKTVSRKVMPRTVEVDFDTDPTSLTLKLDDEVQTMPQRVLTWENHSLHVVAPDQGDYLFSGWANGVIDEQDGILVVPPRRDSVPMYVAIFEKASDVASKDDSATNVTDDPSTTVTIGGTNASKAASSSFASLLILSALLCFVNY